MWRYSFFKVTLACITPTTLKLKLHKWIAKRLMGKHTLSCLFRAFFFFFQFKKQTDLKLVGGKIKFTIQYTERNKNSVILKVQNPGKNSHTHTMKKGGAESQRQLWSEPALFLVLLLFKRDSNSTNDDQRSNVLLGWQAPTWVWQETPLAAFQLAHEGSFIFWLSTVTHLFLNVPVWSYRGGTHNLITLFP